jgi:hypothetical protein
MEQQAVARLGWTVLLAALLAGLLLAFAALVPVSAHQPDTQTYLNFSPYRQLGYPIFLRVFGATGAIVAQPILFALAAAILTFEVARATGSRVFATAVAVAMMVNPEVDKYHAQLLTESLFMTLLVLMLAGVVRYSVKSDWLSAAWIGVFAGLSATIRPTGVVYLAILALLLLVQSGGLARSQCARIAIALFVPFFALVGAERAAASWLHGDQLTSLAGRHLLGKAALLEPASEKKSEMHPLERAIVVDAAPVRALIRRAPSADVKRSLIVDYEGCFHALCVKNERAQIAASEAEINSQSLRVALRFIASAPFQFLELVWVHYRSMWVLYSRTHPDLVAEHDTFIASNSPLPFEAGVPLLTVKAVPDWRAYIGRPLFEILGIVTAALALLALIAAVRMLPSAWLRIAALSGATVQGIIVLTAATGPGIVRYTLAAWPAIVVAVMFLGWWMVTRLVQRYNLRQDSTEVPR